MKMHQTLILIFLWLTRLYPPEFQARFGKEMFQIYRDQLNESGSPGDLLGLFADLFWSIIKERYHDWRRKMNNGIPSENSPHNIPEDVLECLTKGGPAWNRQEYAVAKRYANDALILARQQNSVLGELGALQLLANIAFNEIDDHLSREIHHSIFEKSALIGFTDGVAASLSNLALLDVVDGDLIAAQVKYYKALELYETDGNEEMADSIRRILSFEKIETVLEGIPRKG